MPKIRLGQAPLCMPLSLRAAIATFAVLARPVRPGVGAQFGTYSASFTLADSVRVGPPYNGRASFTATAQLLASPTLGTDCCRSL